jgi:hypothetical protein
MAMRGAGPAGRQAAFALSLLASSLLHAHAAASTGTHASTSRRLHDGVASGQTSVAAAAADAVAQAQAAMSSALSSMGELPSADLFSPGRA